MVCVTFWCTLDRDIHKYLFKVTLLRISTRHVHEYSGLFSPSSDFVQVPVSLREDTTVSQMHTDDLWNLVLRRTHFSCTVSQLCASERKLQLTFTYMWEMWDSLTNAQIQHGLTQGRESSNCSRQIAVCHMVTSWHDDDRHLRLYVEMQSEDSHVRASRVRVVAIGRGRE